MSIACLPAGISIVKIPMIWNSLFGFSQMCLCSTASAGTSQLCGLALSVAGATHCLPWMGVLSFLLMITNSFILIGLVAFITMGSVVLTRGSKRVKKMMDHADDFMDLIKKDGPGASVYDLSRKARMNN